MKTIRQVLAYAAALNKASKRDSHGETIAFTIVELMRSEKSAQGVINGLKELLECDPGDSTLATAIEFLEG